MITSQNRYTVITVTVNKANEGHWLSIRTLIFIVAGTRLFSRTGTRGRFKAPSAKKFRSLYRRFSYQGE